MCGGVLRGDANQHDAAVRLHENFVAHFIARAYRDREHAVAAAEAGVQRAVGVVARDVEAVSGHDDLAVGLQRQSVGVATERRIGNAVAAEGGVQRSVCVVAHQSKTCGAVPSDQQLAIGLHDNGRSASAAANGCFDDAVTAAKGGVEHPISIESHHPELPYAPHPRVAGQDDLAISLQRKANLVHVPVAHGNGHRAIAAKAGVECPVGGVASDAKHVLAAMAGVTSHDDLAVGLHQHAHPVCIVAVARVGRGPAGADVKGRRVVDRSDVHRCAAGCCQ